MKRVTRLWSLNMNISWGGTQGALLGFFLTKATASIHTEVAVTFDLHNWTNWPLSPWGPGLPIKRNFQRLWCQLISCSQVWYTWGFDDLGFWPLTSKIESVSPWVQVDISAKFTENPWGMAPTCCRLFRQPENTERRPWFSPTLSHWRM